VSLVIQGVTRWLDREGAGALDPAQLALLASDAGPLAGDLARWLRARELDAETRA
jgi:hypothetical protein